MHVEQTENHEALVVLEAVVEKQCFEEVIAGVQFLSSDSEVLRETGEQVVPKHVVFFDGEKLGDVDDFLLDVLECNPHGGKLEEISNAHHFGVENEPCDVHAGNDHFDQLVVADFFGTPRQGLFEQVETKVDGLQGVVEGFVDFLHPKKSYRFQGKSLEILTEFLNVKLSYLQRL